VTPAVQVSGVAKTFRIPHVRRHTVREHVFELFGSRRYAEHRVLDGVTFNVPKGQTLGVMGRNGSGKSTLLKIIAGIYQPDAGRVQVSGAVTAILQLGIGWNPELDAVDNIYLLGTAMGLSLREVRTGLDEILAFAELERFANLKVGHYSSGMASRLAYAVAFQAVRDILLLDEVFAVGDAAFRAKCERRYRELSAAGHTVLLVSHAQGVVADFCDRAVLIEQGRVLRYGSPSEVAAAYTALMAEEPGLSTHVGAAQ
jgi:ABC-type polysaccharide/polyol phosphate transport system ATPase subunit